MGTPKSLSLFTLFLALTATPQSAVALRLSPLATQIATVDPVFSLPDSVASGTTIKIGSSSTLAGVNEVVEQRFENQFSGTQVDINYTSSDKALADLAAGTIDIAAIGRPLSEDEKAQGYTGVLLGRHKIALIVSEENPFVGEVTTVQFSQLFRGEITDWSELEGGAPGAIRFVDRPSSNDTRQSLSYYPVFKEAPFEVGSTADSVTQDDTAALVSALGTDGISFAIADQVVNRPGIRILAMHKVLPTNPAYPFSQPMSYVYKGEANPAVQAFLGYITAPDTSAVLDEAKALGAEATFDSFQGSPKLDAAGVAGLVGSSSSSSGAGTDSTGTEGASPNTNSPTTSDGATAEGPSATGNDTGNVTDATPEAANPSTPDGPNTEGANTDSTDGNTASVDGSDPEAEISTTPNTSDTNVGSSGVDSANGDDVNSADSEGAVAAPQKNMPWWLLWLIGIPIFGTLLWWLLSRRTDEREEVSPIAGIDPSSLATGTGTAVAGAAGTAIAGAAVATAVASDQTDQMVLVPRDTESAYAYWELSEGSQTKLREDGGQDFGLRLYDVTSWDQESELPKPLSQEILDGEDCDRHLTIPTPDRDYVAEVGYLTSSAQWLPAARSAPVHVSSDLPSFSSITAPQENQKPAEASVNTISVPKPPTDLQKTGVSNVGDQIKGAAIAGTAAVAAGAATVASRVAPKADEKVSSNKAKAAGPNRLILVPREGQDAYAYWEISEEKKVALQQQGGEKLALRLYDVTGIDPRTQKPHSVQQFDCNEQENDLHVTVPAPDRTYLADLGYTTAEGKWLRLAHAAPVQVPTTPHQGKDAGSTLNGGDVINGITGKVSDVASASKDAVDAGQSKLAQMAKSVINTGSNAGQSLVDGTVQAKQSVVNTGQSLATGATETLNTTVAKTVAAGTAVTAAATGVATTMMQSPTSAKTTQDVQIVLVARNSASAYAYWEIPQSLESELRAKDIETLSLHLHEVTNIDLEHAPANSTQVFECNVTDRDRHVPIPVPNQDYLAELGYTQPDGSWVKLARSLHIRVA